MTIAVAASACVLVACGSEEQSMQPVSGSNQPGGAGGTVGNTGGSPSVATGGSGATTPLPGSNAGAAGNTMAAAGQGAMSGSGQGAMGGSDSAQAGAGGMMVEAGMGGAAAGTGGAAGMAGSGAAGAGDGPDNPAPCTASKAASAKPSGTGPHKVVVETNSDPGINEGTIFRPEDLDGAERYPIYVWGEGGCALQGLSNQAANGEIASHGVAA